MRSKNKRSMTTAERAHVDRIKSLMCSVCDHPAPSDAHELKQGQYYTSVALCIDCHRNGLLGIHGQRRNWAIRKLDELDALAITIRRMLGNVREWNA